MAVGGQTGSKLKGPALVGNKAQDLAGFCAHRRQQIIKSLTPLQGGWMLQK